MACVITGCPNDRRTLPPDSKVTFHRLHDDGINLRKWLRRRGLPQSAPRPNRTRNILICSDHFSDEDFIGENPRRLKPSASPRYLTTKEKQEVEGFQKREPTVEPINVIDLTTSEERTANLWLQRYAHQDFQQTPDNPNPISTNIPPNIMANLQYSLELPKRPVVRYAGDCKPEYANTILGGMNFLTILHKRVETQKTKMDKLRLTKEKLTALLEKRKATVEVLKKIIEDKLTDRGFVDGILEDVVPEYIRGINDYDSDVSDD